VFCKQVDVDQLHVLIVPPNHLQRPSVTSSQRIETAQPQANQNVCFPKAINKERFSCYEVVFVRVARLCS